MAGSRFKIPLHLPIKTRQVITGTLTNYQIPSLISSSLKAGLASGLVKRLEPILCDAVQAKSKLKMVTLRKIKNRANCTERKTKSITPSAISSPSLKNKLVIVNIAQTYLSPIKMNGLAFLPLPHHGAEFWRIPAGVPVQKHQDYITNQRLVYLRGSSHRKI